MLQDIDPLAKELSLPYYEDALPAHDRFHARRVRDLALRLAAESDQHVDTSTLSAAAWLHDIGRPRERRGQIDNHGEWGADEARSLLSAEPVSAERVETITHCLRSHSIRSSSPEPATPEARFLFDADKLDAVGAHGLLRLACIVGERSGRVGERRAVIDDTEYWDTAETTVPDISILQEQARERLDALCTDPGRRLGDSRWQFMTTFFERFRAELGAEGTR